MLLAMEKSQNIDRNCVYFHVLCSIHLFRLSLQDNDIHYIIMMKSFSDLYSWRYFKIYAFSKTSNIMCKFDVICFFIPMCRYVFTVY